MRQKRVHADPVQHLVIAHRPRCNGGQELTAAVAGSHDGRSLPLRRMPAKPSTASPPRWNATPISRATRTSNRPIGVLTVPAPAVAICSSAGEGRRSAVQHGRDGLPVIFGVMGGSLHRRGQLQMAFQALVPALAQ